MNRLMMRALLTATIAIVFLLQGACMSQQKSAPPLERMAGEYIVTLSLDEKSDATTVLKEAFFKYSLKRTKRLKPSSYLITVAEDPGPETMLKRSHESPGIESIQPNFVHRNVSPISN